jgi:hypothetical protein
MHIYMHAHAAAAVTLLRTAGLNQRLQGWFEEGDAVEDDVLHGMPAAQRHSTTSALQESRDCARTPGAVLCEYDR